jgi:hypothetical protein
MKFYCMEDLHNSLQIQPDDWKILEVVRPIWEVEDKATTVLSIYGENGVA